MQVPERLALIGGSILLASTLVFTLKSQASTIIPKVSHSISGVFDHIDDAQKSSDFNDNYQQASSKGWQTGSWGSSKYYIDNDNNMHIGAGQLDGGISSLLGHRVYDLQSISFDQPVHAPSYSGYLFQQAGSVKNYYNLSNLDTSQVTDMTSMFESNWQLKSIDLSSLNTGKVQEMHSITFGDSIQNIDLSNWDTSSTTGMPFVLSGTSSPYLNLSSWDTSHVGDMNGIFNSNLQKVSLGSKTYLHDNSGLPSGNWSNGSQSLSNQQLQDGQSHPGTWVKQ